jgi:hypothetical protein
VQFYIVTAKKIFRSTLLLIVKGVHVISIYFLNSSTFIPDLIYKFYLYFLVNIEENYNPLNIVFCCNKFWVLT